MPRRPLIVGLGEALFDCFGKRELLGGAPVNVAVHAHALLRAIGGRVAVASAVGDDELGARLVSILGKEDIDLSPLQIDPIHPTGRVDVTLDDMGQPSYVFEADVAWDYLQFNDSWRCAAGDCDAVTFGTLAQRSPQSHAAIVDFLLAAPQALRLYDVNLRQDFFSRDHVARSLELASAAKLNVDELPVVARLLNLDPPTRVGESQLAKQLMEQFELDWLVITHGPMGTVLHVGDEQFEADIPFHAPATDADSVGAGDACCAGLLVAAVLDWPKERWVSLANELGAFVASCAGAIPRLPEHLLLRVAGPDTPVAAWRNQAG